jgi:hypothetical protein
MTLLTRLAILQSTRLWYHSSTPGFKAKLNAHSMCAQESSLNTYHTESGYRIANVRIYNIYYRIMSLQKTESNTLRSIAVERHHNNKQSARGNCSPRIPYRSTQDLLQLLSSMFVWQGKVARLSTLMIGTQQVQEINDMQRIITR